MFLDGKFTKSNLNIGDVVNEEPLSKFKTLTKVLIILWLSLQKFILDETNC